VTDDDKKGRRKALTLIGAGTAAFGCALAVPGLKLLAAPVKMGGAGERWVKTVRMDDLREGEPRKVEIVADARDAWSVARDVQLGAAWLVRKGDAVLAFNATCPHLGCSVNAVAEGKGFACPCHTSAFGADGKRHSGPSPRDLDALATKIERGYVHVDFRKFRIGVAAREEIG
jgi:cytochrome b6-f complex iron-sulfur subunit/menaquinol-cytochrome c reductase iron-sulfur subunit